MGADASAGPDSGGLASCAATVAARISGNHGHTLMIPMADITGTADKCYNSRGTATHDHWITVTAADFATLRSGQTVLKRSCNGGDHQYVLSCAATPPAAMNPACDDNSNEGAMKC